MVSKLEKAEMSLQAANGGHKSTTKYDPCELLTLSWFWLFDYLAT